MTNNQNRLLIASQQQSQPQQQQQQQQRQNQSSTTTSNDKSPNSGSTTNNVDDENDPSSAAENQLSVDDDFDLYWREEARNPHRNRIRIGRQYQATVPALLKKGDKDARKLHELETMTFCPKKASRVSDSELDHYFAIAKSLNIFANLVETRSLLGRDVTIADLNHIRHKEGLSLASVIQPTRQTANYSLVTTSNSTLSTSASAPPNQLSSTNSPTSPSTPTKSSNEPTSSGSKLQTQPESGIQEQQPIEQQCINEQEKITLNQPLMRALSHFISLHHPCHHDAQCKKLTKEAPLEENSLAPVLRHGSFSGKETKNRISRSAAKQLAEAKNDENNLSDNQAGDANSQSAAFDDWTREEVELFSKAIEVCGKNFGSIKKDFLPSKSVKSIVEYYYIGYRDSSDGSRKKSSVEANDGCSSPDKCVANNNGSGNGGGGSSNNGSKNKGDGTNNIATSTTTTAPTPHAPTPNTKTGASTSRNSSSNNNTNSKSDSNNLDKKTNTGMIASNDNTNKQFINESKDLFKSHILKQENFEIDPATNSIMTGSNNIDKRMSVYNFDDDNNKDEPVIEMSMDNSRPGPEVRPLKAKPVLPSISADPDADSDGGSLKFFMDGKMVLKLNACQDQQQGMDKCQWVQSNDKPNSSSNRQKRYLKRGNPGEKAPSNGSSQNGSVIESSPSSQTTQDDMKVNKNDYYKFIKNMNMDEDSKESMNSSSTVSQHQDQMQQSMQNFNSNNNNMNNINMNNNINNINTGNNYNTNNNNIIVNNNNNINNNNNNNSSNSNQNRSQKRQKVKNSPKTTQITSSPNTASDLYNGLASNSQVGLVNPNFAFQRDPNMMNPANNPMINQAMPWLQANHIAMAAAILGGLPGFPGGPVMQHNMPNLNAPTSVAGPPPMPSSMNMNQNIGMNSQLINNNNTHLNPVTSKPMDLSLEHNISPKSPQKTTTNNRSRSRQVPRNA